jgi:Tfp pilus assembly protein PilN
MKTTRLPQLSVPLAGQGFGLLRAAQWVLALIIVGSLGSAAWMWWESRALVEAAAKHEQAAERVRETSRQFLAQASRAGLDLSDGRIKTLSREVDFANRMLEKRAFSWTRFLSELEDGVPPHISIGSVTLSFKDSTITLNGTALTLKDVTTLVNNLENHQAFHDVVLSQHRFKESADGKAVGRDTRGTVEFTLTVMYRPTLS